MLEPTQSPSTTDQRIVAKVMSRVRRRFRWCEDFRDAELAGQRALEDFREKDQLLCWLSDEGRKGCLYRKVERAVMNELRDLDRFSGYTRGLLNRIHSFVEKFEAEVGRAPTPDEISTGVELSAKQVANAMRVRDADLAIRLGADAEVTEAKSVSLVDTTTMRGDLERVIDRLPPRISMVVRRVYLEGWTDVEVAQELGITKVSVGQLRAKGLAALRRMPAVRELEP